jgi:hypothetical protein
MLAVQAQEFWGGRWALGVRTSGSPTVSTVDRVLESGRVVRAWTMRGTLHLTPAADLGWLLSVTAERQFRAAAGRHRDLGLDGAAFARAERLARSALAGGERLTREGFTRVLAEGGLDPAGQRGIHLLQALALRGVVVLGPPVPREGGPSREQYIVSAEEWIGDAASPADPTAEMLVRYLASHGPATARDFAWWSGLPLGAARTAAEAASARLVVVDDAPEPTYVVEGPGPRRSGKLPEVLALPPFDEYYLSYVDRTASCAPEHTEIVGPSKNGMVRPVLVRGGEVIGVWNHSRAVGRHRDGPVPELFAPDAGTDAAVSAALERYAAFITG